jgi:type I restriction enzyme S subunit
MKLETFFDNFEMLAEAPNSVQKLRELILQMAVRGKLVAQNEWDEPASVLLKSIRDQIKKSSNSIEENEMPYDLPKTWEWVRLGDILVFVYGDGLPKSKRAENAKYPVYGSNGIVGYHDEFLIDKPGIIVGRKGSCGALNISFEPFWATDVSYYIIPPTGIDLKFSFILLKSLNLERLGKGIKPGLNRNDAYHLVTSLPPLAEQHRIVAKVDQLMSLCYELETLQQKKRESRAHINSAALDQLLAARAPGKFAEGWRRISDNFDLLYDAPENVGALRQAILQLALMGKLVEQEPDDEPVAVLQEKIKAEKERLVNEKKITNSRAMPKIDGDEIPYNLPEGWKWVRLGDICHNWGQKKPDMEFTYIDVSAIDKEHGIISEDVKILRANEAPSRARKKVSKGTVIYATVRPYLLNIAIVDKEIEPEPIVSTAFAVLHPLSGVINRFLYYYLRSKPFIAYVESEMIGMAYPAINDGKLYLGLVPLPPLSEQQRIGARVDQLMSLCDELETGLAHSQADSEKLMEAVVESMLAGGD